MSEELLLIGVCQFYFFFFWEEPNSQEEEDACVDLSPTIFKPSTIQAALSPSNSLFIFTLHILSNSMSPSLTSSPYLFIELDFSNLGQFRPPVSSNINFHNGSQSV
ncbi:hypothetical protein V8G54_037508 [Vigna mungo]|uniref:Uncharacterized protein n=1 Tax=Vigna mungo TaxID=3915 RepID=A0AAQ3MKE7_VIGMU